MFVVQPPRAEINPKLRPVIIDCQSCLDCISVVTLACRTYIMHAPAVKAKIVLMIRRAMNASFSDVNNYA
jgi:hypothetical protein